MHRPRQPRLLALAIAAALLLVPTAPFGVAEAEAAQCRRFDGAVFDPPGADGDNLNGEWVRVRNVCSASVTLGYWRIRDRSGNTYRFPSGARLGAGRVAYLHTGRGSSTSSRYYWGRRTAVWGNDGTDRAHLVSPGGTTVSVWPRAVSSMSTSWFGRADPWAGLAFGSFPEAPAGQMRISGDQGGRVISRLTFRNRPRDAYLYLDGVRNLTIDLVDFDTVPEGIVMYNSENVTIRRIRARNIYGPYTRTTAHTGNLIQVVNSRRITISDVKLDQPDSIPSGYGADYGTEDIISLGGDPGRWGGDSWDAPFLVERFALDGGAWQSRSGTGIFVGDGASGKYVWIRDGILLNPGQTGIGTGEEGPYRFERLDILGPQRTLSNDSIQLRSSRAEFRGVRTDWRKSDGTKVGPNWGGHSYADLGGNQWLATLDRASLEALVRP